MKTTVQAIEHADIRGKKQKYLVIGEGTNNVIINVGDKTFNAVKNLENPNQQKLPLTNEKKGGTK